MMKVAYACVLTAVCAHEACPSSDPTCSAAEEAALLQHAATRHVKVVPSPSFLTGAPLKSSNCVGPELCRQDFVDKLSSSWKTDPTEPFLVGMGQKIFDLALKDVTRNEWHKFASTFTSGDTNGESTKALSAELGIDASYGAFEGSAQINVQAQTSSKTASFFSETFDSFVHFEMVSDVLDPVHVITPEVKTILTTWTVEQIHETLGDFFATKLSFGGTVANSMLTTMYKNESSASLSASANAAYDAAMLSGSVKASFSGSTQTSSGGRTFTMTTSVTGGNELIWLQDLNNNCSNYNEVKHNWADNMTLDTMIPVHFALQPMWRLLEHIDAAKSEELKKYMLKLWKNSVQILPYNGSKWKYLGRGVCNFASDFALANANTVQDCEDACQMRTENECSYIMYSPHSPYPADPKMKCIMLHKASQCDAKPLRPIKGGSGATYETYARPPRPLADR